MKKKRSDEEQEVKSRKELLPIDGEKLRQALWDKGYHSYAEQAQALGTNERRLRKAIQGGSFQQATIVRWGARIEVHPKDFMLESAIIGRLGTRNGQQKVIGDWQVEQELTRWIEASNGLQYRIVKLSHRHLKDGRLARGKLYDMAGFSDKDRVDLIQHLQRHPTVCQQIGQHPHIAVNLTALPDLNGRDWWVVDQWIPGRTLKDVLADSPLAPTQMALVMRGIAEGLVALHRHGTQNRDTRDHHP